MRNNSFVVAFVAAVCASCGTAEQKPDPPIVTSVVVATPANAAPSTSGPKSLYERLGGKGAIEAVVDQFIANVAADDRINHRFVYADFARLRGHLVDQVCAATGGPCTYKGGCDFVVRPTSA